MQFTEGHPPTKRIAPDVEKRVCKQVRMEKMSIYGAAKANGISRPAVNSILRRCTYFAQHATYTPLGDEEDDASEEG